MSKKHRRPSHDIDQGQPIEIVVIAKPLPTTCPACGARHDNVSGVSGTGQPKPGSVTICTDCLTYAIFTETMGIRLLTNAEWAALSEEHRRRLTTVRDAVAAHPKPR